MEQIPQAIKDKLQKACLCRGITVATIKDAIRDGKGSVYEISAATGATQGGCKGHRCNEKIQTLIETYQNGEWE